MKLTNCDFSVEHGHFLNFGGTHEVEVMKIQEK